MQWKVFAGSFSWLVLFTLHPVAAVEAVCTPAANILSTSPDGKFLLRRLEAISGELGEARKEVEITTPSGRVLYKWISPIGATSALWSSDSKYLAVNEAPGDQGDQLRLFALDSSKPLVTSLREPNGRKLRAEVESRHGSFSPRDGLEGGATLVQTYRKLYPEAATHRSCALPPSLGSSHGRGQ